MLGLQNHPGDSLRKNALKLNAKLNAKLNTSRDRNLANREFKPAQNELLLSNYNMPTIRKNAPKQISYVKLADDATKKQSLFASSNGAFDSRASSSVQLAAAPAAAAAATFGLARGHFERPTGAFAPIARLNHQSTAFARLARVWLVGRTKRQSDAGQQLVLVRVQFGARNSGERLVEVVRAFWCRAASQLGERANERQVQGICLRHYERLRASSSSHRHSKRRHARKSHTSSLLQDEQGAQNDAVAKTFQLDTAATRSFNRYGKLLSRGRQQTNKKPTPFIMNSN